MHTIAHWARILQEVAHENALKLKTYPMIAPGTGESPFVRPTMDMYQNFDKEHHDKFAQGPTDRSKRVRQTQ